MDETWRDRVLGRATGAVIGELLAAARSGATDPGCVADLRAALTAGGDEVLHLPLFTLGIDSLTWMAVLTAIEEKFGVLFADEVALDARSYTISGLSGALVDALPVDGRTQAVS